MVNGDFSCIFPIDELVNGDRPLVIMKTIILEMVKLLNDKFNDHFYREAPCSTYMVVVALSLGRWPRPGYASKEMQLASEAGSKPFPTLTRFSKAWFFDICWKTSYMEKTWRQEKLKKDKSKKYIANCHLMERDHVEKLQVIELNGPSIP